MEQKIIHWRIKFQKIQKELEMEVPMKIFKCVYPQREVSSLPWLFWVELHQSGFFFKPSGFHCGYFLLWGNYCFFLLQSHTSSSLVLRHQLSGNHPCAIVPLVLCSMPRILHFMGSWARCRAEMTDNERPRVLTKTQFPEQPDVCPCQLNLVHQGLAWH